MRRVVGSILALIVLLLCASAAGAQTGNGLYEPFPKKASSKRAKRYIERLPPGVPARLRRLSDAELERGLFVGTTKATTDSNGPSLRGGVAPEASEGWPWPAQLGLLLVPVVLMIGWLARRPGRPGDPGRALE